MRVHWPQTLFSARRLVLSPAALALALFAAFAAFVVAACSEEETGSPASTVADTPEATETPIDPAILAVVEAYADKQGWQLVGYCFGDQEEAPSGAEPFCYFQPKKEGGKMLISIGRVQSGETYLLTLEQQANGKYRVIEVIHSSDIPSSGPP